MILSNREQLAMKLICSDCHILDLVAQVSEKFSNYYKFEQSLCSIEKKFQTIEKEYLQLKKLMDKSEVFKKDGSIHPDFWDEFRLARVKFKFIEYDKPSQSQQYCGS